MDTCDDILKTKGDAVLTVAADATVLEAVQLMCARRVGALLVGSPDELEGIISERDVMTRVVLSQRSPRETKVSEVMTREVVFVELETSQREAMAMMTRIRCRHLPVVVDGRVVGMVSIGDLVRAAGREYETEVRTLTAYIQGVPY
jgi:CBS domain-containing protein